MKSTPARRAATGPALGPQVRAAAISCADCRLRVALGLCAHQCLDTLAMATPVDAMNP